MSCGANTDKAIYHTSHITEGECVDVCERSGDVRGAIVGTGLYNQIALAAAGDVIAAREVSAALLAGVCRWFLAGEKLPLTEYLPGVAGHDRRAQKLAMRDYWLMRAFRECQGSTTWPRAVALEREIKRFETAIWPLWRDLDQPPDGASALRTALFHAFKIAERMPRARGLAIPRTAKMLSLIGKSSADAISQCQIEDAVSKQPTGDG